MSKSNKYIFSIVLVLALVLIAVGGYSWLYPGQPEVKMGQPIVVVNIPELSIAAQSGKQAFDKYCASCHGSNAVGQEGKAPPLIHRIYEPNHHGDMAFVLAAKNGVRAHHWSFGNMPPVDGVTEAEIKNITIYIRELQRANGIN
ncbi:c-type cytochrome [Sneathiella litorea]|uniref:C-type cytochrome n=1 Tax=Sneathiella litorea TaxID=2606216 RepID=A0A6L8W5K8_9PROT|nr:cytochrome c [Sneathiella litorea]MZR30425.1 c-type cytochrome [Sneathiella litorea]